MTKDNNALKIVAIDDDACDLNLISNALVNISGVEVVTFANIDAAVVHITLQGASLVLLDLSLPSISGLAGFQRIYAELGSDIPIIVITDNEDIDTYRQAIKAGAQDCICKDHLEGRQLYRSIHNAIERQDLQQQLRSAAQTDAMTGLPNRSAILAEIDASLRELHRTEPFSILFLDIDNFKTVNDSHNHAFGDKYLIEFVKRVSQCLAPRDRLARFGGDEFVLLLRGVNSEDEIQSFMGDLRNNLDQPLVIDGNKILATVSVGIATADQTHTEAGQLLREADLAMFTAKTAGKSRFARFDAEMRSTAIRNHEFERTLGLAVEDQELQLSYQPLVNIESGRTLGFEALVRWQHQGTTISPLSFIAIAERTGAIHRIGAWVLKTACQQMAQWDALNPELGLSVNVSPVQLEHRGFVDAVLETIRKYEIDPRRITLEVTESVAIKDCGSAIEVLNRLRRSGVKISIDDFGTGHSSLSQLHRLPVDEVKIDRAFTRDIEKPDNYSRLFVQTIHMLASGIGLSMIAEGIETEGQRKILVDCGYRSGQGYLFSKPLTAMGATSLLASNQRLYGEPCSTQVCV